VSNEPEYLQRLRKSQEKQAARHQPAAAEASSPTAGLNQQEREAVRWGRELAKGTELRSIRTLPGARFAALLRLQGASGVKFLSLEGFESREQLLERIKPGATVGEEVLGAYEVKGGRPVTIATDDAGQVVLKIGAPRPGANPVSPEKMIRKAEALAHELAKTRPKGDADRGRGRR
jgi:hypothetical protein